MDRFCVNVITTLHDQKARGNSLNSTMEATADGSEILRAPAEVGSLSHYLQAFLHPRWLFGISEPSTVSWDF